MVFVLYEILGALERKAAGIVDFTAVLSRIKTEIPMWESSGGVPESPAGSRKTSLLFEYILNLFRFLTGLWGDVIELYLRVFFEVTGTQMNVRFIDSAEQLQKDLFNQHQIKYSFIIARWEKVFAPLILF